MTVLGHCREILVVVPWLMGGGAQSALEGVLRALPREKVTLIVLFEESTGLGTVSPLVGNIIEFSEPKSPRGVVRAAREFRRYLESSRVVYSLMRASHLVLGVSLGFGRREIPPIFASVHQLPSWDAQGVQGHLEDLLVGRVLRKAELVTTPSTRAAVELKRRRLVKPESVHTEPNILSKGMMSLVEPRRGELGFLRLVFAGRLTTQKGLDQLVEWFRGVRDVRLHLRIVGTGPERARVEQSLTELEHFHIVEFVGQVDDVTDALDWADALLLPSRTELNPVVLWEARYRGRPVIASKIPAFVDLANDGGVLLVGNPEEAQTAVAKLAKDDQWRQECYKTLPAIAEEKAGRPENSLLVQALRKAMEE